MNNIDFSTISLGDLAALVNKIFSEHGMKTVLVGGACVAIYSHNRYLSSDLFHLTGDNACHIKAATKRICTERA